MTAPRPTSDPALAAGAVLGGRYRLEALIARGGASEVYRATDITLGRDVAVKVVALDAAAALEREASMLALTGAPQVPACYDRGIEDRVAYLVMEYVPGPNLAQALDAGPALPEVARHWAAAATRAVEAVHARGVVHGDLKPSHFVLTDDGGVRLVDFGCAFVAGEGAPPSGRRATAAYLDPAATAGATPTFESDRYALRVTLGRLGATQDAIDAATA